MIERATIERASAADRAFLAMDTGGVPEQFGVILRLAGARDLDLARVRQVIAERIPAVPRLRQRLVRAPWGCGAPLWVDDPGFDVTRHVRAVPCPAPEDDGAVLDTGLSVILTRTPRAAPPWSAVLLTGPAGYGCALVVVMHHVLADGLGGLAVLGALLDPGAPAANVAYPRPPPPRPALARDAWLARVRAPTHLATSWRSLRRAMSASGGVRPPRAAGCSLLHPTGPRRAMAVVTVETAGLRAAAHRYGATTNDAVLVAVAGALDCVLQGRAESLEEIAVAVPVSGRGRTADPALGNLVSPLLVGVPTRGDIGARLARVEAAVRAQKAAATGPPPIAVLGWLFRPMARLGGYRFYLNHQRRFHTLVSHVRGPHRPVAFDGHEVSAAIGAGVGESGNVTAHVAVLSYAGMLAVTATVDPDHFPDLDELARGLRSELALIAALA